MSLEKTLALIKPDAVAAGNDKEIEQLIEMHGFTIIQKKRLQLTRKRAEEFYGEHRGKEFFHGLVDFMTSGPIIALCLAKEDAIKGWRALMGPTNSLVAKEQAPKSLRAIFGTDGRRNATHGSDSPASAQREIKFYFPEVSVEPTASAEQARAYMNDKLNSTLLKGLSALATQRPTSNPFQAILWLSDWLLHNNPNKPKVMAREEFPLDPTREDDEAAFKDVMMARAMAESTRNALDMATARPPRNETVDLLPEVPLDGPGSSDPAPATTLEQGPVAVEEPPVTMEAAPVAHEEAVEEAAAPPPPAEEGTGEPTEEEHQAAIKVQALYRGHKARKEVAGMRAAAGGEGAEGEGEQGGEAEVAADDVPAEPEPTPEEAPQDPPATEEGEGEAPTEPAAEEGTGEPTEEEHQAAIKVQALYRGHKARKEVAQMREGAQAAADEGAGDAEPEAVEGEGEPAGGEEATEAEPEPAVEEGAGEPEPEMQEEEEAAAEEEEEAAGEPEPEAEAVEAPTEEEAPQDE